jgi:diguanylate cyclase (GGDEF)-like protein
MANADPIGKESRGQARYQADLELLLETARDLASTLSTHEVIERLVRRTLVHLDSEIASVQLREPDGALRIMHAVGLPETLVRETRTRPGEGIAGHVAATGQSLLVADVETDPRFSRRNHERYYTHSCISAPLVHQGRVRGVINVNNKSNREAFSPADLRLLEILASHAAIALLNADRFEEALERAQRDALTGLANHGHFWTTLETELKRASRYERPLSLVMVDVDHFKGFNDLHGHLRGDAALVAVARTLAERSRAHDLPARYGGEEFAVLLPETDAPGALAFGEKIRQGVEALAICRADPEDVLTVSVGVASLAGAATPAAALVEAADAQLYRAKAAGRNRVCAEVR